MLRIGQRWGLNLGCRIPPQAVTLPHGGWESCSVREMLAVLTWLDGAALDWGLPLVMARMPVSKGNSESILVSRGYLGRQALLSDVGRTVGAAGFEVGHWRVSLKGLLVTQPHDPQVKNVGMRSLKKLTLGGSPFPSQLGQYPGSPV